MAVNAGPTVGPVKILSAYAESSFANDESAALSSYTPIPFVEGAGIKVDLQQEMIDPGHGVQHHHDYREEILGKKGCTIAFTIPLSPTGTAAGQGQAALRGALGLLLSTCMGGEDLGQGSLANAGWTAKAGGVATNAGFEKGAAIGWVNAAGALEARPLANKVSSIATKLAFSAAPATSDPIYSSATYYLTSDPAASLNFAVRGLESDDDWLLLGCQMDSMTISLPLSGTETPTVAFTFKGATWLHGDDAAGTFSDITPVTYSNASPISGHAGRFMARTTDTQAFTSGVTVNVSAVAFEPQLSYVPITSPSGTESVLRWRLTRNNGPSLMGSFTTYYEGQRWHDARLNKDDFLLLYQIGQAAGSTILLEAATAQITGVAGDSSEIESVTASWKARKDSTVTTASTDLHYSPFRIHLL